MSFRLIQGLKLIDAGQYEAAHSAAIQAIKAHVYDPEPYFVLARIAQDHKNFEKADELYVRARELGPKEAIFAAGYGQFLALMGKQRDAIECAEVASTLNIEEGFVADTIGVIFSRTGLHERAVPFFEKAVSLNPDPANFHYNLGASLQFSGQFDRAALAYQASIDRDPDMYRSYSSLVGLSKQTPQTNRLDVLYPLFDRLYENPDAALHLGHAIAKTLEDLGDYAASFDWLGRAKHAKRTALRYDVGSDLPLFEAAARTAQVSANQRAHAPDDAPIFIIGLPRTGTTLIDRVISSHPEVSAAGELNTFAGLIKALADTPSNRVLDVETLTAVADVDLAGVGADYVSQTRHLTRGAPRFTDKMPLNFFYAGLILKALPNARIVAVRRSPLDSCVSNYRQLFSTGFSYYNYALSLTDTADYYLAFDRLMATWRDALPSHRYREIAYEDIVHHQERETRDLLAFCDLSWDEACLNFQENAAPVSTASSVQVRQPIYSSSIGRWKRYGDKLDTLRSHLAPVLQETSASRGT